VVPNNALAQARGSSTEQEGFRKPLNRENNEEPVEDNMTEEGMHHYP